MAGKATQSKQAADVIGGKGDANKGGAHELQTQLDATTAELEQANKLVSEHAKSLEGLGVKVDELRTQRDECERARAADRDQLRTVLVGLKLVTEAEAGADEFDPVAAAQKALADVTAERNSAKRSLAAQKGATTRKIAEIEEIEASLEPRKLGPIEGQLAPADLYTLLCDEARVEVAFSDGKSELIGVPPVAVRGDRFTFRRGRLQLSVDDLTVRGPADERGARVLAGYALLADGEQVAWLPRLAGQLTLGAGQSYQLKDDVVLA